MVKRSLVKIKLRTALKHVWVSLCTADSLMSLPGSLCSSASVAGAVGKCGPLRARFGHGEWGDKGCSTTLYPLGA